MTQDLAQAERDVEVSRSELDRTVAAFKQKMAPSGLAGEARRVLGGAGDQILAKFIEQAKENPMPLAVMGASLVWLMSGSGKADTRDGADGAAAGEPTGERTSWAAEAVADKAAAAMQATTDKAAGAAAAARESVAGVASGAAQTTRQARDKLSSVAGTAAGKAGELGQQAQRAAGDLIEKEPLLIGGLGLVVGLAIGAALPVSEAEQKVIGPVRDHLVETASELAHDRLEDAGEVAKAAYTGVKAELQGDGEPAERAERAARSAARAVKEGTTSH